MMAIPVEKRVITLGLIAVSLTIYALVLADQYRGAETTRPEPSPLTDTLTAVYEQIITAARSNNPESLTNLLNKTSLFGSARTAGSRNNKVVDAYLLHLIRTWPDLDTLTLMQVRESGDYVRLDMLAPSGNRENRIRYIFLLFKMVDSRWRLCGLFRLVSDRFDPYGRHIGYHETDLPPAMRFPRRF